MCDGMVACETRALSLASSSSSALRLAASTLLLLVFITLVPHVHASGKNTPKHTQHIVPHVPLSLSLSKLIEVVFGFRVVS